MSTIPTFSADGKRLRNYSLASIEKLLEQDRMAVERNRAGKITCATMRPADRSNPIATTAHMGQSYSFLEHLPSGHCAWSHSRLLDASEATAEGIADAEAFVRNVFMQVPNSIAAVERKLAPVICIDEFRRKAKRLAPVICIENFREKRKRVGTSRPIEFDSRVRLAA